MKERKKTWTFLIFSMVAMRGLGHLMIKNSIFEESNPAMMLAKKF
jgi:hypothetical protein